MRRYLWCGLEQLVFGMGLTPFYIQSCMAEYLRECWDETWSYKLDAVLLLSAYSSTQEPPDSTAGYSVQTHRLHTPGGLTIHDNKALWNANFMIPYSVRQSTVLE